MHRAKAAPSDNKVVMVGATDTKAGSKNTRKKRLL